MYITPQKKKILFFFKYSFPLSSGNFVFVILAYGSLHALIMHKQLKKHMPFAGRKPKLQQSDSLISVTSFCKELD